MKHYVYKLTEKITNEFYYGVRTCECNPNDDSYMGSMKSWKPNKDNLIKEIISEFETREEAVKFETMMIEKTIKNPLNRNYHSSAGLAFFGKTHEDETKRKISKSMSKFNRKGENNPFYGKKHLPETLKKISPVGRTHSDETKQKMSESASNLDRSKYNLNRKKVLHIPENKIYDSMYMASKQLGINRATIRKHINGEFKPSLFKLVD